MLPYGCRTNFNFILKCHCTDDFSRQELRCSATAKVVGTRQTKNLSCTLPYNFEGLRSFYTYSGFLYTYCLQGRHYSM